MTVQVKADDPLPANLGIESAGGGSFGLSFDGVPGWTYHIQYTEDLSNPDWQDLTSEMADGLGVVRVEDLPPANAPRRYYRAVWP